MSNSQEQMLIQIYKAMPSAEIERRIASGGLIPLAMGVAENELQQRLTRGDTSGAPRINLRERVPHLLFLAALFAVLIGVAWVIFPELAVIVGFFVIPWIAMTIGQAYPKLGLVLGSLIILLSASPFVYWWNLPKWQDDGWGKIFLFIVAAVAAMFILMTGISMIGGARQRRSRQAIPGQPPGL